MKVKADVYIDGQVDAPDAFGAVAKALAQVPEIRKDRAIPVRVRYNNAWYVVLLASRKFGGFSAVVSKDRECPTPAKQQPSPYEGL